MSSAPARPRGRPAAASRDDVLAVAVRRYHAGERIDLRAIASELGLARATLYRWYGSRVDLVGEVLLNEFRDIVRSARDRASGTGAVALLDTFDRINRTLATAAPLRRFLEIERDGVRLLTSSAGPVEPGAVAEIAALIEREVASGAYEPPIDAATMAFVFVRLCEAFIYNDAAASIRGEVERLHAVQAVLLGLPPD